MAVPVVAYKITVEGAAQSEQDTERVRTALENVQGSLDAGAGSQQRYAQSSSTLSQAEKQTAASMTILGDTSRETHQRLFEGARLGRTFADTLLGSVAPGLQSVTGEFTRLSRETGGFSVGMVFATGALLAGAAAIGYYLNQAKEFRQIQLDANKAIEEMDFTAAQSGLAKAVEAQKAYNKAVEESQGLFAQGTSILGTQQNEIDVVGVAVALFTLQWGKLSAAASAFATDSDKVTESLAKNAAASEETGASYERGRMILEATGAELQAHLKHLDNVIATVPSLGALASAYADQAQGLRTLAQITIDLKAKEDERYAAKHAREIEALEDEGLFWEAAGREMDLDEEMALRRRQRAAEGASADEADLARRRENARTLAEQNAKEIADAGRIVEIRGSGAAAMAGFAAREIEDRQRVLEADSRFFGTAVSNVEQYLSARRSAAEQENQIDLDNFDKARANARKVAAARLEGLTGPAYAEAFRQNEQAEAESQEKRRQLVAGGAAKIRQIEAETTTYRRQQYAQMITQAEQVYSALAAMGQEDARATIARLRQRAQDENLEKATQLQYAQRAFAAQNALDDSLFALRKVKSAGSELDAVNHLAAITTRYSESSQKWIDAETRWAESVKALRQGVADAGKSYLEKIVDELKAEGNEWITLDMIRQRAAQDLQTGQQAVIGALQGGAAQIDQFKAGLQLGPTMADFQSKGVSAFQAITTSVQQTAEQLLGIPQSTGQILHDFQAVGASIGDARTHAEKFMEAFAMGAPMKLDLKPLTDMNSTLSDAVRSLDELGAAAGRNSSQISDAFARIDISSGLRSGLEATMPLYDDYFNKVKERFRSGASNLGNEFLGNLADYLKKELDSMSGAS
jgi:hypothetical protein